MLSRKQCILLIIIYVFVFRGSGKESFDLALYRCSSFEKFTGLCKDCNSHCRMPVISTKGDYEMMKKKMQENKVSATWLGLRRVWLGEYLWLDCSEPFDDFLKQNWSLKHPNCASLHIDRTANKAQLEPGKCESAKPSLCQVPECKSCHALGKRKHCWKIDHTCFAVEQNPYNWETARVVCRKMGGSLAIITEEKIRQTLKRRMNPPHSSENYWVGLRREEWTYSNMDFVPLKITTIHWDKGEPSDKGNCSIMIKNGDDYVWRVVSCTAKYSALCIKPGQHIDRGLRESDILDIRSAINNLNGTSPKYIPTGDVKQQSSNFEWAWTVLIGLVIILLAALLAVLICMCLRSPKKKTHSRLITNGSDSARGPLRSTSMNTTADDEAEGPQAAGNGETEL